MIEYTAGKMMKRAADMKAFGDIELGLGVEDYEKATDLASSLVQMSNMPEGDMSQMMTDQAQKAATSLVEVQQKHGQNFQAFITAREEMIKRVSELREAVAKLPHDEKDAAFMATSVFDEY